MGCLPLTRHTVRACACTRARVHNAGVLEAVTLTCTHSPAPSPTASSTRLRVTTAACCQHHPLIHLIVCKTMVAQSRVHGPPPLPPSLSPSPLFTHVALRTIPTPLSRPTLSSARLCKSVMILHTPCPCFPRPLVPRSTRGRPGDGAARGGASEPWGLTRCWVERGNPSTLAQRMPPRSSCPHAHHRARVPSPRPDACACGVRARCMRVV